MLKPFLLGSAKFSVLLKQIFLASLWKAATSAGLAADVSLVSILQAGDWAKVSMPARHYFSTYITAMDQHQDSVQCAVLSTQ